MRVILFLLLLTQTLPAAFAAQKARREGGVYAVVAELDRLSARGALWDGFDPRRVPLEIYYGQTTYLFRHPNPPPEFISLSSRQGVYAFPGRHESVTANRPVKLNGVWTATAMLAPGGRLSLRAQAALVVHEAFHAFQRERHPEWDADELELFVYPFDDAEVLRLRRLESEALRRAAEGRSAGASACWAAAAIELRRARFARMSKGSVAYERGTELNEGLASYVEARAAGLKGSGLPAAEFAAEDVRRRSYLSGRALAVLLDRFAPGWKRQLEASGRRTLDELLEAALQPRAKAARCEFMAAAREAALTRARSDVGRLLSEREASKRDYLARPGWKIVVEAGAGAPLWPQGFDPLNVRRVGGAEVLHTRYLKLGNDAGAIEILGRASLSEGAGQHPLFNGVRRLTVSGLAAEPVVSESGGRTTITASDAKAEFRNAEVARSGLTLVVRLK